MPDSRRSRPARTTAALLAAAALALTAGCQSGGGHSSASPAASKKPSPSPSPAWDRSPKSVAAVGDSITRGFDACTVLADCPEVSWATGSDAQVDSSRSASWARRPPPTAGTTPKPAPEWPICRPRWTGPRPSTRVWSR